MRRGPRAPDGGRRLPEHGDSTGGTVGRKFIHSLLLRSAQCSCPVRVHLMILGQATIAALATPNLSDAREYGADSAKKHETHPLHQTGARGRVGSFSTRHYTCSTVSNLKSWSLDRFTLISSKDSLCSKIVPMRDFNNLQVSFDAIG